MDEYYHRVASDAEEAKRNAKGATRDDIIEDAWERQGDITRINKILENELKQLPKDTETRIRLFVV